MKISNKLYDILKFMVTILFPASSVLLVTLNSLWSWNLPIEAISGTIAAVATFIGVLIGISSAQYKSIKEGDSNG